MIVYDEKIIQVFAQKLYDKSYLTTFLHSLGGAIVGGIVSWFFYKNESLNFLLVIIGGAAGAYIGSIKGFLLKLQAQSALCQMQTERNTRGMNDLLTLQTQYLADYAKDGRKSMILNKVGAADLERTTDPAAFADKWICTVCKGNNEAADFACRYCSSKRK